MTIPDELENIGYPPGTFKLGQRIYLKQIKNHRFWIRKKCDLCDSTGKVKIKNEVYSCPKCKEDKEMHEIREVVQDNGNATVKSIITVTNNSGSFEVYTTSDVFHCIHLIHKNADSEDIYYPTIEEAQAACNKYNDKYNVYAKLEEYRKIKIIEDLAYWEFKESLLES